MNYKQNKTFKMLGFKNCCPTNLRRRLCDLGFVTGITFRVVKCSILRKVYLIEIGGFTLSIQENILKNLELE